MNPHSRTSQGECCPVLDGIQQHQEPETDLSRDSAPPHRGIADYANQRWAVIMPDQDYEQRPEDHIIRPWQVDFVRRAPSDLVNEAVAVVERMGEPRAPGEYLAYVPPLALGSGQHSGLVNHAVLPHDAQGVSNHVAKSHGHNSESENLRQVLVNLRESGVSLDGLPSRSVEEGGVSGLFELDSGGTSNSTWDAASVSSCASLSLSDIAMDRVTVHTAQAVQIRSVRADRRRSDGSAVHRMPSPEALDRIDAEIEDAETLWKRYAPTPLRLTKARGHDEGDDGTLSGRNDGSMTDKAKKIIEPHGVAAVDEAHRGPSPSRGSPYTHSRPPPTASAEGHPSGVEQPQAHASSPTPSESSIAETVFNVRTPTPPPQQTARPSGVASLPSSQWLAGTQGVAYAAPEVEKQATAPAMVLVDDGWLGFIPPTRGHEGDHPGGEGDGGQGRRGCEAREQ